MDWMPVRRLIHKIGVWLFRPKGYSYLKSLFARFLRLFGWKHVMLCVVVGGCVYAALLAVYRRKEAKNRIAHFRAACGSALSVYYVLLALYTLVFRMVYRKRRYNLELFWSYKKAMAGATSLYYEIVLNYFLLLPIGLIVPILVRKHKFFWTMVIGTLSSAAIEVLQLLLRRGLFELDDLIGNVLGVILGYGIYVLIRRVRKGDGYGKCEADCV